MKTRIIRTIVAGLAVFTVAVGGATIAEAGPSGAPVADTGWGY